VYPLGRRIVVREGIVAMAKTIGSVVGKGRMVQKGKITK